VCHDQCCQSKDDAITNKPLEDIHVCWITPDGESRQCYNLDTLRKFSLANRTNNLLEPPHFRSHLSVELKEQIISKFGRSGLIVEEHDYVDGDEYFHDRFTHYMTSLMGLQDIYVCPICYCYKYKSISEAESDEQSSLELIRLSRELADESAPRFSLNFLTNSSSTSQSSSLKAWIFQGPLSMLSVSLPSFTIKSSNSSSSSLAKAPLIVSHRVSTWSAKESKNR